MWVLKVSFADKKSLDVPESASIEASFQRRAIAWKSGGLKVTRVSDRLNGFGKIASRLTAPSQIEVLQSSTEANARLWSEEGKRKSMADAAATTVATTAAAGAAAAALETAPAAATAGDSFIDGLRQNITSDDWTLPEFSTLAEQRTFFAKEMRTMARTGHDEEDGWQPCGRTAQGGVASEDQLDLHKREVDWSPVAQLRAATETQYSVEAFFEYLLQTLERNEVNQKGLDYVGGSAQQGEAFSSGYSSMQSHCFVTNISMDRHTATCITYRMVKFPW